MNSNKQCFDVIPKSTSVSKQFRLFSSFNRFHFAEKCAIIKLRPTHDKIEVFYENRIRKNKKRPKTL